MSATQRIGIIGCGSVGVTHSECLAAIEDAKLVAFCDTDSSRADELRGRFGGKYATDDPARIFRDDGIDAVYICTYHATHGPLVIQAAEAGKHIMMEKPLALSLSECNRVANAVEKSGVKAMTGFKMRYYPSVAKARTFVPSPIVTIAQMMDRRWPDEFWANDPVKGGGNILSQGCHTMDLVCHFNQSEPVRIYAEGGNFTHSGLSIFDNMVATITFANGSVASVAQGDSGETPFVSKLSFQLLDGERTVHLHNRLKSAILFDGTSTRTHDDPEEYGFMEENRDFIDSLKRDEDPTISLADGVRATLMVLRAIESLETQAPQRIAL